MMRHEMIKLEMIINLIMLIYRIRRKKIDH